MGEAKQIVVLMLDDLLFENLDIHFLEPQVQFISKTKIKPTFAKHMKPEQAEALNYMRKVDRTKTAGASPNLRITQKTAVEKRLDAIEIKPKINLALKLQVTK